MAVWEVATMEDLDTTDIHTPTHMVTVSFNRQFSQLEFSEINVVFVFDQAMEDTQAMEDMDTIHPSHTHEAMVNHFYFKAFLFGLMVCKQFKNRNNK